MISPFAACLRQRHCPSIFDWNTSTVSFSRLLSGFVIAVTTSLLPEAPG